MPEPELRVAEEKFRAIFDNAMIGIVLFDFQNNKLADGNKTICQMLGYDLEDLRKLGVMDIFPEKDRPHVMAEFEDMTWEKIAPVEGLLLKRKDGTVFYAVVNFSQVTLSGKKYLIGLFGDITTRRQAEEASRFSEERYRSVVENIGIGVSLISPNMEILSLNKQMKTWFPHIDLSSRPLCYRAFNEPPREEICSYCPTCKALQDGQIHEALTETPAGDKVIYFRIISSPVKDQDGRVIAAIEMVEDITERKNAEDLIRRLYDQNKLILSSAGEGIFGLDSHGNHTFINPAATRMLGYTADEFIGMHSHTALHYRKADGSQYPEEECPIYQAHKDGRVHRIEDDTFWRKDGTSFTVAYTSTPIIEDGQNIGAVVTFRDITESKNAEKALQASEVKFRNLFDQAADLIAIIDLEGNFIDLNRKFEEEAGWTRVEMIGRNVLTSGVVTEESARKISFHLSQLVQGKEIPIFEVDGVRKDGGIIPYELRATPIQKRWRDSFNSGNPAEYHRAQAVGGCVKRIGQEIKEYC